MYLVRTSLRKQSPFRAITTGFPGKKKRPYPDLGSASDWSCRVENLLQPIRSTAQIWLVARHEYGLISALVCLTSFRGGNQGWRRKMMSVGFAGCVQTDATTPSIVAPTTTLLGFDRFQTLRNNTQQHPTGCANGRNMKHPTMLGVVGQQCSSACRGLQARIILDL